jgi:hypothetical protein
MKEFLIILAVGLAATAAYEGVKRVTPVQRKLNILTLRKHNKAAMEQDMHHAVFGLMDAEAGLAKRLDLETV